MVQVSGEFPALRLLPAGQMGPSSVAFLFGVLIWLSYLAFLVLEFLLLDFVSVKFYGAQQEGEVLLGNQEWQRLRNSRHHSLVYISSLLLLSLSSLSSLCTLEYTHGSPLQYRNRL
jgi:hypothetical protein